MRDFENSIPRTIVLIGMMGVGKTSIGRKLAKRLDVEFKDSDQAVEDAAKCTIADIFEIYGEKAFRDVEYRVISRLLGEKVHVLATGGSAFADPETQKLIKERGISIWLKADYETLLPRIERRDHRPQFGDGDVGEQLQELIDKYSPHYDKADIKVDCNDTSPEATANKIILELNRFVSKIQSSGGQKIHHV
ncbi:MAG: shikimate kinase [Alphaproteobacteria bacterium]